MKTQKSWLKDFTLMELSDERIAEVLTLAGIDVEDVISGIDKNVIVAKILKIERHPNADKLQVVIVDDGSSKRTIVCGATNIEINQLVPLALPGAKLIAGEIKETNIRGIDSSGMLCAADELGIGDDHSGIYVLPADWQVGKPLVDYLGSETVFDLDITANRGDCLSHIGLAREVAAFENSNVRKEPVLMTRPSTEKTSSKISIEIKDAELCPQYLARVIEGVKIGPSPKWLQDRLIACGAKPINNVVDVTNFILLDLGHPMHAFDAAKIKDSKIIVRKSKNHEDIVTLDGEIRHLDSSILVISDPEKVVAIAGIMGGENSEVDDNTETIILEAAEFDPKFIRAAAKKLNLSTEASYRFERGIDSGAIEYAINKAASLIAEVSGGRVLSGIVQSGEKPERKNIAISHDNIRRLLGKNVGDEEIEHILRHLGFMIENGTATVPTWRHDISIWQDLAEEVGRVVGYDKIDLLTLTKIKSREKSNYYFVEKLKDLLDTAGYTESMNYPFLSENDLVAAKLKPENLLEIQNPIQPENKYLRLSLIPGLLKNIAKNPAFDPVLIFEIGHVFSKTNESQNLAIASTVKDRAVHDEIINKALALLPRSSAKTSEFSRQELQQYKIKRASVFVSEINLSKILNDIKIDKNISLKSASPDTVYRGVSKFPAVSRDLAFIVDKTAPAGKISDKIYSVSELINRVELFDEFASDKFGLGKKNLAFHIYLQSKEKTLNDNDALEIINSIIKVVENKFNAKLRKG
jgi:phenylalanyl-tRNA synthetase beta chain